MTDKGTIRLVVLFLGLITLVLVGGAMTLVGFERNVPDPIWALAGGGLGAFTTLLASTRSAPESPDA